MIKFTKEMNHERVQEFLHDVKTGARLIDLQHKYTTAEIRAWCLRDPNYSLHTILQLKIGNNQQQPQREIGGLDQWLMEFLPWGFGESFWAPAERFQVLIHVCELVEPITTFASNKHRWVRAHCTLLDWTCVLVPNVPIFVDHLLQRGFDSYLSLDWCLAFAYYTGIADIPTQVQKRLMDRGAGVRFLQPQPDSVYRPPEYRETIIRVHAGRLECRRMSLIVMRCLLPALGRDLATLVGQEIWKLRWEWKNE